MKTLIATNNSSKFKLVSHLLQVAGLPGEFVSPVDLHIDKDVEETGSLKNRANQKAAALRDLLQNDPRGKDITLYVGVDDGIRIEKESTTYLESYEATDRILAGDGVEPGDAISIVRAFAFITDTGQTATCIMREPLRFLGNPEGTKRSQHGYPLARVLAWHGDVVPIGTLETEEALARVAQCSTDILRTTLDQLSFRKTEES